MSAGKNAQRAGPSNAVAIENAEDFHVEKVSMSLQRAIQKARQDKGMSQKDLATKINEKPSVVADYEAGRGWWW